MALRKAPRSAGWKELPVLPCRERTGGSDIARCAWADAAGGLWSGNMHRVRAEIPPLRGGRGCFTQEAEKKE